MVDMLGFLLSQWVAMTVLVSGLNHGTPRYACEHPQGKSCFYVLDEARNQSEAERKCAETRGGHLATVGDMSGMEYLKYLLTSTHTQAAWIGAHYSSSDTSDGVKCGVMAVSEAGRTQWTTRKCSKEGQYACIYKRDSHTRPCRYEFHTCGNYCLRRHNHVFGHPQNLDWYSAKQTCLEFGANFPAVRSLDEAQAWVNASCYSKARSQGNQRPLNTWTEFTNIQWRWSTGETVEYAAWHPSFPVPELGKCVKISKESMGAFFWKNEPCATKIPAICQIPYPPFVQSETRKVDKHANSMEGSSSVEGKQTPSWLTPGPVSRSSQNVTSTSTLTTQSHMAAVKPGRIQQRRDDGHQQHDEHPEYENRPKYQKPRPSPSLPTPKQSRPLPVLYIGLAVAVCVLLIILLVVIICCWRRRQSNCSKGSRSASAQKDKNAERVPVRTSINNPETQTYSTMTEQSRSTCGNVYEGLGNDGVSRHEYEMLAEGIARGHESSQPNSRVNVKPPLPRIDPIRQRLRLPSLPHAGKGGGAGQHGSLVTIHESQTGLNRQSSRPTTAQRPPDDDEWQYLEVIAPPEHQLTNSRPDRNGATKDSEITHPS